MSTTIILKHFKNRIEVPVFFLFFAFMICDAVKTNLIIFRTCYVTMGYNQHECALLGSQNPDNSTARFEKIVEPKAAIISMLSGLGEGISSAIACLFAGPWSDRFGRKPVMILPLIGYSIYYLLIALFSVLEHVSPWYSVICLLPTYVTGGFSTYLAAVFCCITDSTSETNRGLKMGYVEASMFSGVFLGTVSSSYLFTSTGYSTVFFCGATCCFLALVYTIWFIPESLVNRETEGYLKEMFQVSQVQHMVKVTFKKRENYARFTIFSCIALMMLSVIVLYGNGAVIFLFLREKFHWSLHKYTLFSAFSNLINVLGILSGVYFLHRILRIPETILILVAWISSLNANLLFGLISTDRLLYAVPFAKCLDGVFGPMTRSLISKIIPKEELGKIFSILVSSQFLVGAMGSPLYTLIYNKTIDNKPEFFTFVSSGIYIFGIIIAIGIIIVRSMPKNPSVYENVINEDEDEEEFDYTIENPTII